MISLGSGRGLLSIMNATDQAHPVTVPIDSHVQLICDRVHEDVLEQTHGLGIYFRFDAGRDLDPALIKEWCHVPLVKTHTTRYLQGGEVNSRLDEVVRLLQDPSNGIVFSTSEWFETLFPRVSLRFRAH